MPRGDVYRVRVPNDVAHAQHGDRVGVVVQANEFLPRSVVTVAPTSRRARPASFRPEIDVAGDRTRVLVEQTGAVDSQRPGDLVGHVTPEEIWGIDEALATVLGLDQDRANNVLNVAVQGGCREPGRGSWVRVIADPRSGRLRRPRYCGSWGGWSGSEPAYLSGISGQRIPNHFRRLQRLLLQRIHEAYTLSDESGTGDAARIAGT